MLLDVSRRRTLLALVACGASACSLLVETGGFSESGEPDAAATPDATPDSPDADVIEDGGALDAGDGGVERVTDGLAALFLFREDAGVIVHDTAPEGEALELVVERAPAPDGDGGTLPPATSGPTVGWTHPGMSVLGRVLVASPGPASTIASRCAQSGEITVEAWITPASETQSGPARIVTNSFSGSVPARNFMLGQSAGNYVFRLRHSAFDGGIREWRSDGGVSTSLSHVVVTARSGDAVTFHVDGLKTTFPLPSGQLGFVPYRVALANEIDGFEIDRLWRGDFHLVAVYCRALSEQEVRRNREAGPAP